MKKNLIKHKISNRLKGLSGRINAFADRICRQKSKLIKKVDDRSLYLTPAGIFLWLNETGYVDREISQKGIFESLSTGVVNDLVKEGDVVIDVGANIGYYTTIFSKLVGESGHIYAFEPTRHFSDVLRKNLSENKITNVSIIDEGLSDSKQQATIDIGPSSATMHSPPGYDEVLSQTSINLNTLDTFVEEKGLDRIDFIKIDVDGHEPYFFEGAWKALNKFKPVVLCEISHLHYLQAGVTAWDFYQKLIDNGLYIYLENDYFEITSKEDFLRRCSNFNDSCNIVLSFKKISGR